MCRWLAYSGPPLLLDELLFKPENSLIRQSMTATQSIVPTNGDGFGLGWYGNQPYPCIFHDTLPAWNDANLLSLAEQIQSELFFAHVRASTGTSTSRRKLPSVPPWSHYVHAQRAYRRLRIDPPRARADDLE